MGIGGFHDVIIRPVVRRYIGEAAEPVRMGVHVIPVCAPAQYAVQNRCRLSPRDGLVRSESPITETVEVLLMVPLSLLRSRGKNGPDRVVAVNISECIGRHCAYAGFIHQYILNHIARLGTDGKALICPLLTALPPGLTGTDTPPSGPHRI